MTGKVAEWKKVHIVMLLSLVFIGSLSVLSFIGYSDGDDAFFLEYCGSMGLGEYLKWRYETWTGRMISEALMHIFFNADLWVWRIVNAGMLVALPTALAALKRNVLVNNSPRSESTQYGAWLVGLLLALLTYAFLDIKAFGYSAIWITGSMNYLWPMVSGLVSLGIVAETAFGTGDISNVKYIVAWLCAVIAAMSSEQMGAVLLAFEIISIAEKVWKKKKVQMKFVILAAVTLGAFLLSSLAPGNALRIESAIEHNMPQFEQLTFGERFFLLAQWLVSSFANENAVFLIAIWLVGILLLVIRLKEDILTPKETLCVKGYVIAAGVFLCVAVAGKCGVGRLNDIGINLAEMTGLIEQVPQVTEMTMLQWRALVWWLFAMLFTLFFLWKVSRGKCLVILTYMGAVASEVILIFSPTIYSSGERVFFLAGIMLMFLVMMLYEALPKGKVRVYYVSSLVVLGIVNLVLQAGELLTMM